METNDETIDKIKTRVIGIDIRLDKTTYVIVDIRGEIVAQDYFDTSLYPDVNDFISALADRLLTISEENGVVCLDFYSDRGGCAVVSDGRGGAWQITRHLIGLGHRKIGFSIFGFLQRCTY